MGWGSTERRCNMLWLGGGELSVDKRVETFSAVEVFEDPGDGSV